MENKIQPKTYCICCDKDTATVTGNDDFPTCFNCGQIKSTDAPAFPAA